MRGGGNVWVTRGDGAEGGCGGGGNAVLIGALIVELIRGGIGYGRFGGGWNWL